MKRLTLLAALVAALAFAGTAAAGDATHYGRVIYNGGDCGACQMVISTPDGTNVVGTGSTRSGTWAEIANPTQGLYHYTVCVGGCSFSYNSYGTDRCWHSSCTASVWYRRPCFSGYQFSPAKSGYTWITGDPMWWGNFTINTSGCYPSVIAARADGAIQ